MKAVFIILTDGRVSNLIIELFFSLSTSLYNIARSFSYVENFQPSFDSHKSILRELKRFSVEENSRLKQIGLVAMVITHTQNRKTGIEIEVLLKIRARPIIKFEKIVAKEPSRYLSQL